MPGWGKDEEGSKKKRDRKRTQNERQDMLTHILNEDRNKRQKRKMKGREYGEEKTKGEGREGISEKKSIK